MESHGAPTAGRTQQARLAGLRRLAASRSSSIPVELEHTRASSSPIRLGQLGSPPAVPAPQSLLSAASSPVDTNRAAARRVLQIQAELARAQHENAMLQERLHQMASLRNL